MIVGEKGCCQQLPGNSYSRTLSSIEQTLQVESPPEGQLPRRQIDEFARGRRRRGRAISVAP